MGALRVVIRTMLGRLSTMSDALYVRYFWVTKRNADNKPVDWCVAQVILNGVIAESVADDAIGELRDRELCRRSAVSRVLVKFNQNIGKDVRHEPQLESVPDPRPDDSTLPAS